MFLSMRSIFLSLISLVYLLYYSKIKVSVDVAVHSEYGELIKCDFKPGSVERSIDLYQRWHTSAAGRRYFQFPQPIKIEKISCAYFPVGIKIHRSFFKFDNIRDILEAQLINSNFFLVAQSIYWLGFCLAR
jgi:hypothetical protein